MRFPYRRFRARQPVLALGGRAERPRPHVLATLIGPTASSVEDAFLDSCADDTVFPDAVARDIGIDLSNAPTGEAAGIGSSSTTIRYAKVELRLTDGKEFRRWRAWVGFSAVLVKHGLLGFAGCLQFFTAKFDGAAEVAELEINALYPGT